MENKVIYVPVSVQEELPDEHINVPVLLNGETMLTGIMDSNNDWAIYYADGRNVEDFGNGRPVTHWLKKIELASEEEIRDKSEDIAKEKLSEIHKHTTLCIDENEENIFHMGVHAGLFHILSIINQNK